MTIKQLVILAAGRGNRLMPLTFHQPKGMVAVADKPMIHYIIDEAAVAGIRDIIIVVSPDQWQFKKYTDYLQSDPEWKNLKIKFRFAVQKNLLGSADGLLAAKRFLKKGPFLAYVVDDLLESKNSPTKNLIKLFSKTRSPILVLKTVPKKLQSGYGMVKTRRQAEDFYQVLDIIEKPKPGEISSNLGSIGRYLLSPEIFPAIQEAIKDGKSGEVAIAHALKIYLKKGGRVFGYVFRGRHFDGGSKAGLLQAQIYFGLKHPEFKKEVRKIISYE